jgi:hypothetical protein
LKEKKGGKGKRKEKEAEEEEEKEKGKEKERNRESENEKRIEETDMYDLFFHVFLVHLSHFILIVLPSFDSALLSDFSFFFRLE